MSEQEKSLQQTWDEHLAWGWINQVWMPRVAGRFFSTVEVEAALAVSGVDAYRTALKELGLRRIPLCDDHMHATASVFVATALPKTNFHIFDWFLGKDKTPEKLALRIGELDEEAVPGNVKKNARQASRRSYAKKTDGLKAAFDPLKRNREESRRSSWSTTKKTHNK